MSKRPPLIPVPVVGYAEVAKTSVIGPISGKQVQLFSMTALNRSGGAIDVGLAIKLAVGSWTFGVTTALSTPDYFEATSAIQAGTATDLFAATNDGFLVQADRKFGIIGITVSTGGASGVYTYKYYNGASYVTLTTIAVPAYATTGDKMIVFAAPQDWVAGSTAAVGGYSDQFSILVTATTAPANAVTITAIWIGQFLTYRSAVANNGAVSLAFSDMRLMLLESGEGVMPYFGTASAANTVEGFYSISD